ncbi:hypothetical protein Vau01_106760 [Virgisporangium aurantiacum]|uniref:Uncharacterized protein n=1 Tax=Virgisporangium aurantiacum TaxID=175570 RepID=A0A8J4E5K4_9ACTN|nr:hypothetical protein Vau01_106760 [Virgisporangium aurantiacum]
MARDSARTPRAARKPRRRTGDRGKVTMLLRPLRPSGAVAPRQRAVPESVIVETLVEEALRLADEMGVELPEDLRGLSGPTVTVH